MLIHCMPQSLMEAGYKHYYNKALKVFQVDDITVLTPTKKAKLGTVTVNSELQNIVNQFGDNEIAYGNNGVKFREGDRVMNIKNQYDVIDEDEKKHDIVNGDQGVIVKIDTNEKKVLIDFEFARVWIPYSGLENIVHSLAMTMHKSQGSGIPCVISIMDKSHKFQVNANLLYTAWTRARTSCIAVTQADVINYAIGRNANMERNTFLRELLISGVDKYNNK
ncbi:hypothetical protein QB910_000007 [Dabrowskivirus KKP3916]|uniref:Uncharacterized protein n=1 Tax=Alicyclobacillus phage KKP_3916 TaxID=3040651 RepID=A0AAT9V7H3_9CAUD|nr:hypothetical protein QB910_000007 [Alicyclobacillus phage KKP 3916]